jgi:predicted short-subunit dehydrogenase-like oxidoreductase (DUF2520 family)
MPTLRVVGPGRAGLSLSRALAAAGWRVLPPLGRSHDLTAAAVGVDLVVIATPDGAVAEVAAAIAPVDTAAVAHMAGSLGLTPLGAHARPASIHPLVSLPDPDLGARRLRGAWFAVAGDPIARRVVDDLGGTPIEVGDADRVAYHAAACVASNHLVALLGSVERIAATAGVPLAAYLDLVRATVDNVEVLGTEKALTGPAARGDWDTINRHRAVLPERERDAYEALLALIADQEPARCS